MNARVGRLFPLEHTRPGSADAFERAASFVLLATPALFAMLTFQATSDLGMAARRLSLPVRLAELLLVAFAMRDGFRFSAAWHRLTRPVQWAAAIWIVGVVAAAAFAVRDPALARALAAGTLLHGLTALALIDRLRERPAASVLGLLRAAAFGLAGYALAAVYCLSLVPSDADFPWSYFSAGVTNVRQIGFYGLPLVGIALGLTALAGHKADRRCAAALLFAGMFLVIWSGGRAAALGAVCAIGVAILLSPGQRARLVAVTGACILLAALLAHGLAPAPQYGPASLLRFLSQDHGTGTGLDQYSSGRLQFWQWTWEDIVRQPLIGHGEGQFAWMIYERIGTDFNHPHNVVLQIAYEWGVPGLAALVLMAGGVLLRASRLRGAELAYAVPALSGITGLGVTALMDGALYYPMPLLTAFLFLAVIARGNAAQRAACPDRTGLRKASATGRALGDGPIRA